MTQYCPICETEYQDTVEFCADDGALLTSVQPNREPVIAKDVYAAAGEIEAEAIQSILSAEGIDAEIQHNSIAQMPLASNLQFVVVVPERQRYSAAKLIQDARNDGVISTEGLFL